MRPASAAPSISDGASNHAVATPSTTRQSVPISVMPGTVQPIPDDLLPDSDDVPAGALRYAVDHDQARRHLITYCRAAWPTTWDHVSDGPASTMRSLASSSPWARYADSIAISTCVPLAVFAIASAPNRRFRTAGALCGGRRHASVVAGGLGRLAGGRYRTSLDKPSALQRPKSSALGPITGFGLNARHRWYHPPGFRASEAICEPGFPPFAGFGTVRGRTTSWSRIAGDRIESPVGRGYRSSPCPKSFAVHRQPEEPVLAAATLQGCHLHPFGCE